MADEAAAHRSTVQDSAVSTERVQDDYRDQLYALLMRRGVLTQHEAHEMAFGSGTAHEPRAQWRNVSPGEYDDTMECICGFRYMRSADATTAENNRRATHECTAPPPGEGYGQADAERFRTALHRLSQWAAPGSTPEKIIREALHAPCSSETKFASPK